MANILEQDQIGKKRLDYQKVEETRLTTKETPSLKNKILIYQLAKLNYLKNSIASLHQSLSEINNSTLDSISPKVLQLTQESINQEPTNTIGKYPKWQKKVQTVDLLLQKLLNLNPTSKSYLSQRAHILQTLKKISLEMKENLATAKLPLSFKEKVKNLIDAVNTATKTPLETANVKTNKDLEVTNETKNLLTLKPDLGSKETNYKSKSYWKNWLKKMFEYAFEGNWSGTNLEAFLKQLMNGMLHYNDMPKSLRDSFANLMKTAMEALYELKGKQYDEGADVLQNVAIMIAGQLRDEGYSATEAEQMAAKEVQNFVNGIATGFPPSSPVYGWLTSIGNPDWEGWSQPEYTNPIIYWPSSKDSILKELDTEASDFLTTSLREALTPSMQSFFWECIKNENVWEKISDIVGGWDYMTFNSIMDVKNLVLKTVQEIRNILNEMQQDLDQMTNKANDKKGGSPAGAAAAKDFKAKIQELKGLSSSRWLGGEGAGSAGASLDGFLKFLNTWGSDVADNHTGIFSNPDASNELVAYWVYDVMTKHGHSPSSDQQQISTNFSNLLGTFSTASETQSMGLQNSETQLDADLKVNNSCRQTMTNLIHVITNYSNG